MKELISMEQWIIETSIVDDIMFRAKATKYANLLTKKPTLSMFVPTDDKDNILEEPENPYPFATNKESLEYDELMKQYKIALSKVVFEGWYLYWKSGLRDDLILKNNYNEDVIQFRNWRNSEVEFNFRKVHTISDLTKYKLKLK